MIGHPPKKDDSLSPKKDVGVGEASALAESLSVRRIAFPKSIVLTKENRWCSLTVSNRISVGGGAIVVQIFRLGGEWLEWSDRFKATVDAFIFVF